MHAVLHFAWTLLTQDISIRRVRPSTSHTSSVIHWFIHWLPKHQISDPQSFSRSDLQVSFTFARPPRSSYITHIMGLPTIKHQGQFLTRSIAVIVLPAVHYFADVCCHTQVLESCIVGCFPQWFIRWFTFIALERVDFHTFRELIACTPSLAWAFRERLNG